jgi:hypothetical protein|tara:strand:- start:1295 stop:1402 length:108 start_codon:yes stop_codon:yes gene_type:complete
MKTSNPIGVAASGKTMISRTVKPNPEGGVSQVIVR